MGDEKLSRGMFKDIFGGLLMYKKIIICDLDGCLIDTSWIWEVNKNLKLKSPQCWEFFENNANSSWTKIDFILLNYLKNKKKQGFDIEFLTARSEVIRKQTIEFLERTTGLKCGQDFGLMMRPVDDESPAVDYKKNAVTNRLSAETIALAIDDDKSIVEMYKKEGINSVCWQIGSIPIEIIKENFSISNLIGEESSCI